MATQRKNNGRNIGEWRSLIPRHLTMLGEVTGLCLHDPSTRSFYDLDVVDSRRAHHSDVWRKRTEGLALCASSEGREMFMLRPIVDDARAPTKNSHQAVRVAELYERFMRREPKAYFNCHVPPVRRPRFAGELVILRYLCDRQEDDEDDADDKEYEHYFEQPGEAPAYADLWSIGYGQFYVPPGPWRVDEWIEYAPPLFEKE